MKISKAGSRRRFTWQPDWPDIFLLSTLALILLLMTGGDALLASRPTWAPGYIWALFDVPVHCLLSILVTWPLAACSGSHKQFLQRIAAAGLAAILIDIDHFAVAGSFSLYAATHLDYRPVTHSLLFALACALAVWRITRSAGNGLLILAALASHLLRDAAGGEIPYLLWPFGFDRISTAISYILELALALTTWRLAARYAQLPLRITGSKLVGKLKWDLLAHHSD